MMFIKTIQFIQLESSLGHRLIVANHLKCSHSNSKASERTRSLYTCDMGHEVWVERILARVLGDMNPRRYLVDRH